LKKTVINVLTDATSVNSVINLHWCRKYIKWMQGH